jgi:DNA helicase-2/ATP-dependent DNA helicase PcrA
MNQNNQNLQNRQSEQSKQSKQSKQSIESNLLVGLNPQQISAVTHAGSPLLVVAGAGSGKTRVLTRRIAYLMAARNVAPHQILAITFTNKAAGEMKMRVAELVGERAKSMMVSTFHSACVRMLRTDAAVLGYKNSFTIYDQSDSQRLAAIVMNDLKMDTKRYAPRAVSAAISNAKNELMGPADYQQTVKNHFEEVVAEVFAQYQKRLKTANSMDFDDLIMNMVAVLQREPNVRNKYRSRFRHILVDEYQDTNHAQYQLISELVGKPGDGYEQAELCVVGDADQSIYAFRGATIRNILQFEEDYPDANTILLEQNYRSTQNILSAANAVIANNEDRKAKNLWSDSGSGPKIIGYIADSEHDEAEFVISEIVRLKKEQLSNPGETAIFYRTNAQSRVFEEVFLRVGIPYKVVGGVRFYERKEVKDILAYLRVIENDSDEVSLRRIINTPKRGIGDRALDQLDTWRNQNQLSLWQGLTEVRQIPDFPARSVAAIVEFVELIKSFQVLNEAKARPSVITSAVLEQSGLLSELSNSKDPQDEVRVENLQEFVSVATDFETMQFSEGITPTLGEFLEQISLVADADEIPEGDDHGGVVTMMTLHTAKGLEFPTVFLTGMEEGVFPHNRAIGEKDELEEERRLAYVGLTRAQRNLYVSRSQYRSVWGAPNYNPASRFLQEIPEELIDWQSANQSLVSSKSGIGSEKTNIKMRSNFAASAKSKSTKPKNQTMQLTVGERVSHDTFGLGTVVAVNGDGDRAEATIDFGSAGEKRLLLRYAPVEKLS